MSVPSMTLALAAGAVAVALTGCSAEPDNHATLPKPSAASAVSDAPAPGVAGTKADHTVIIDGALTRAYGLPTIEDFARSSFISDVITGEVISTTSYVVDPGTEVFTDVTIKVTAARNAASGTAVTLRETGGVVRLGDVGSAFAGRMSAEELKARADDTVDFKIGHQPHTQPGEHVLVFVGGLPSDPGGRYIAARMVDEANRGRFTWMGEPFNDTWVPVLDRASAKVRFDLE